MKSRVIAVLLVFLTLTSVLSGCQKQIGKVDEAHAGHINTEKQNVLTPVPDSNIVFLSDGNSDYKIILPESADENEIFAAQELQYFIEQASGAKLKIVTESAETKDGKCIFVGATKAAETAGVVPTYDQTRYNGFRMVLIDDDLYLRGYTSIGTRNSVYEFLQYLFDYDFYAPDEIYVENVTNANMPAFDMLVNPSFDWRTGNYGWVIWDETNGHRMRMNSGEEIYINGWNCHYSYNIVSPEKYDYTSEQYKSWFSPKKVTTEDGTVEPIQLCYSSEEMLETYIANLLEIIAESEQHVILLGQQDHPWWCECDKCNAWEAKYGTNAAVTIPFLNKVQAAVDEWFAENRPGQQPTMCLMFAYYETSVPPAVWNEETKAWEPIDETMVINPHSGIMFAPIDMECDMPFCDYDPSDSSNPLGQLLGWTACTQNIYAWTYSLLSPELLVTYNTFETIQKNNQTLLDNGCISILDQTISDSGICHTGWNMAKAYLQSKLQWDNSLNMAELMEEFFQHYYDDAAPVMYELFIQQRQWLNHIYEDLGANGTIYDDILLQDYWSYNLLESYLAQIDKAYEAIEPMQETDPERYAVVHDRIVLESLQFRYLKLQLYYAEYGEQELRNMRLEFRYDFERLGLTDYKEHHDAKELWKDWDIS